MKKLLIGAVSAAALTLALSMPASAAPGASQACKVLGDLGLSHGECVSLLQANFNNGNADAVGLCKFTKEFNPALFDALFKNLGDCVSSLRSA
jgi:hypothetical protein